MYSFGKRSKGNISYVHPDMQRVLLRAIQLSDVDFGVQFPVRTKKEQSDMLDTGASMTLNSRHLMRSRDEYVHAVDVFAWVDGKVSWDMGLYKKIAKAMFRAAIETDVQIEWGGLWTEPEDGPHFQLAWEEYP